jgi:hypothetical protein
VPDILDTTRDVHTFSVSGGNWWLNSYQSDQRVETENAFVAFQARHIYAGEPSPRTAVDGVYRYTLDRGIFCPLGRIDAPLTSPEDLEAVHALLREANQRWYGRDDMGDIQPGERIVSVLADGSQLEGTADHTSWGDWYTAGGILLIPATDAARWRRA